MHGSGGLAGHSEDCWTLICALQPCTVANSSHRVQNLQSISEGQEKRKNSSRCCSEDMGPITSYTAGRCCTPKPIQAAVSVSLHRNVHRGGSARAGVTASLKKPTVCCLGSLKLPCAGLSWCESHNGRVCQCLSSCIWGPRYQQQAGWGRRTHPTSSYAQGHQQVQGQDWEGHGASALSLYGRAVAHHTFAATLVLPRVHRAATGASCV